MNNQPPTIKEMARRLDVSISTVSRALQNHPAIGLRTKERVAELAKALKYVPNQTAINLRKSKTSTIGIVLPDLVHDFFSELNEGIENVTFENDYNVLICQTREEYKREEKAVRTLTNGRVDGIIASLSKDTTDYEHYKKIIEMGIPVVFVDRLPSVLFSDSVTCDVEKGAFLAVEALIKKGCTNIAHLKANDFMSTSTERCIGYAKALSHYGITQQREYLKTIDLTTDSTEKAMAELLQLPEPPDAVLAFNDYVAIDAIRFCMKNGLKMNTDITFASFSNIKINNYLENPPFITVDQSPTNMGAIAAQILLESIGNQEINPSLKHIRLEPTLVFRGN